MDKFASKEEKVHYVFEHIAKRYDLMNSVLSAGFHKRWRKITMKRMNIQPGQSAIDVCAGTGDWTIALAEKVGPTGKVVGLDFSQEMLKYSYPKIEKAGVEKQTSMIYGNAMELPYEDDTFQHATIGFALRNVPDIKKVLSEMMRVVKPGGQVVSLELSKPVWKPFRALYFFYFYKILPAIGNLASRDSISYSWLPESLTNFPDQQELKKIMEDAGMTDVKVWNFFGGICALHIGKKPVAKDSRHD
ncbi:bifunctional demethylmenaquinone methyltransferase/2-methoxy-6-polyprenyl-1,4-benzoquinol methylase [Tumebacillus algifaecis]|uniref:Demethylmenaquinone methyltransferase n=1 Tax=Tumebacillus algifaecis TaxID=1214604 RepID=A0A223D1K5_9BACL|nr:demethylmenaquinone methyltransferase [Tumebacillus algifaecis]ASS75216.1 bifunctional demethylmenaquinone methyltransferase/2-methoxy-6-polyprenyl-1,4-benzoquinol methylase [Tumebacillus algifaecis]